MELKAASWNSWPWEQFKETEDQDQNFTKQIKQFLISLANLYKRCASEFCTVLDFFAYQAQRAKFKKCVDSPISFYLFTVRSFIGIDSVQHKHSNWTNKGECYCHSFVILTCSVDIPNPCENWVSTPRSKRITLRSVHMERFAYVCKFCIYAKFANVCKSLHVYAFTHVCKICTCAKVGKFAPASDQVQISFCVYANFAYTQIWSCEQEAKFAYVSIYLIVLYRCGIDIVLTL